MQPLDSPPLEKGGVLFLEGGSTPREGGLSFVCVGYKLFSNSHPPSFIMTYIYHPPFNIYNIVIIPPPFLGIVF